MSEESIFHEVSEELRRDRLRTGWRRYGPYVIGAAILVVVAVAANEGWQWWQSSNAARSSDQFFSALDLENSGDLAGAQKALDAVITTGSGQYPVLAKFKEAGLLARQGKPNDALAAYDALANQGNTRLRSLALLLGANVLVDKGDVAGVKSRIQGLLAPNDPLHDVAGETLGLAQYKAGDLNGARDSFEAIVNDPAASQEQRSRVQFYLQQLVAEGVTLPTAPAAPGAGAAAPAPTNDKAAPAAAPASSPAAPAPAADSTPAASAPAAPSADATTPAGVESNQPVTPDAALDMAAPAPAAPAATPAPPTAPATPATGTTGQ